MFTAQFNKLGIAKTYTRLDILFMPIKSSFLCAISTCKTRLNCMLLSDLIVLFESVQLNSSFFKKYFAFKNLAKRGFWDGVFWQLELVRVFFSFQKERGILVTATSKLVNVEKY